MAELVTESRPSPQVTGMPISRRRRRSDWKVAALLLAPAVAAAVVLRLWPTAKALWDSLHSTPLGFEPIQWVGFEQYTSLFTDPTFLNSLRVTLLFGIIVNPLQILVSLALAVLFNEKIRGGGVMRTLVFLPVAIPQSVSAVIWAVAFRPDGPLNGLLQTLGLPAQPFLTSSSQAMPSIIVVVSWIGVGYWMMFLIAGLKEIDPTLYEAATVDGAGRWRRFWNITIPQLHRQLAFVLVANTVSNLLVFAPVQVLTRGGPNRSTDLLMHDIFERAYVRFDSGGAAAGTIVLVLLTLVIVAIQFRLLAKKGEE